jgi:cytochrome c oxidase subunit II
MAVANTQVQFDGLFGLFTYLAVAVGVVVFSLLIYFIVKYREKPSSRQPDDTPILGKTPRSRGHARSVVLTLSLSTIIIVPLIIGSFGAIDNILTPPAPSQVCDGCGVLVTGHQFYWHFAYPNGHSDDLVLRVPVGHSIRLNVTSADVFHDFGIIGLDIKTDAIPGRTNVLWFTPYQVGNFVIQCFELCGVGHATMKAILNVVDETTFQQWYTHTRITCSPSSVAVNQTSQCTASVSDSSPSGIGLTPKGNVTFSTPALGYFNARMCTLIPSSSNGSASCSVLYTPTAIGTGSAEITAEYGGDPTQSDSSGNAAIVVT